MPSIPPRFPPSVWPPVKQASILDPDCDGEKLRVPKLCNKGRTLSLGATLNYVDQSSIGCSCELSHPWYLPLATDTGEEAFTLI